MKYSLRIIWTIVQITIVQSTFSSAQQKTLGREIHVRVDGNDSHTGSASAPLKTIQGASDIAEAGDVVIVHEGIYRERVNPSRGGTSSSKMISYQAASGERVEIKGSEVIKGWKHVDKNTWMVRIPNSFFGAFNPYVDTLHGDWLERGKWCHTGEVYLNNVPLSESETLESMIFANGNKPKWFAKVEDQETSIWANFIDVNPNDNLVEINVRQTVFYPEQPYVNYIHVKGFILSHAATPWAPPTAEQIGLIGTHWSKGWIIEDNIVSHSKCVGITIGKYGDEWDNKSESAEAFVKTTERALENNWNREFVGSHIVRNNRVLHCGQAGIAGSLGAIYSIIADNEISDIGLNQQFWGYEIAGLKLHAPVDVLISHNHIYRTEGGIWLDWMTQGTRITKNLLHENKVQDFSLEVNHGPVMVDNNMFLSEELAQVKLSQGIAFINNIIAWKIWPTGLEDNRQTPYLVPHGTTIAGLHHCPCGNVGYYNNLFTRADNSVYDQCPLAVKMEGNLYLAGAVPAKKEVSVQTDLKQRKTIQVVKESDGWYLEVDVSNDWALANSRNLVRSNQLGLATIPQQDIGSCAAAPKVFDRDYFDNKRNTKKHYPGAIEFKKSGLQKIKVF